MQLYRESILLLPRTMEAQIIFSPSTQALHPQKPLPSAPNNNCMQVKNGDTIRVHYKGTLTADGSLFDSSEGREPLEFKVGEGMVINGFDQGVVDMKVGDKKVLEIPHLHAYGPYNEMMIFEFDRAQLPEDMGTPEIGMVLHMMDQEGHSLPVAITELSDDKVKLDANHPLAGKDLTFEIELVEIV